MADINFKMKIADLEAKLVEEKKKYSILKNSTDTDLFVSSRNMSTLVRKLNKQSQLENEIRDLKEGIKKKEEEVEMKEESITVAEIEKMKAIAEAEQLKLNYAELEIKAQKLQEDNLRLTKLVESTQRKQSEIPNDGVGTSTIPNQTQPIDEATMNDGIKVLRETAPKARKRMKRHMKGVETDLCSRSGLRSMDGMSQLGGEHRLGKKEKGKAIGDPSPSTNKRRTPTEELKRAKELQNLNSCNPSFIKIMKKSHVLYYFLMSLPKDFCNAHLPMNKKTLFLEDENGSVSEVTFTGRDRPSLCGGWKDFAVDHNLKVGDCLLFLLTGPTKFKVFIVKANSD